MKKIKQGLRRLYVRYMPDKIYLQRIYKGIFGHPINFSNPKTFNEKLHWLKIYDRNPLYTALVDKYEVKKIVGSIIGKEYIIPTLGVWESFEDIDFDELPERFVLKCTHDSGGVIIVTDKNKLDYANTKKVIEASLRENFYYKLREWPYKNVKPRIIAEEFLESSQKDGSIEDYKLMCFNGKVKCSFVCTERNSKDGLKVTFFDRDWNRMPFDRHYPSSEKNILKPVSYELMITLAEKLSENIPFVRVDFYEIDGKPKFGEMTFYPGGGIEEFTPQEWDEILGGWLKLPNEI